MSEKLICQWTVLGHETLDWAAKFSSENCQLSSPIPFIAFTPKIVPGTISCALPEIVMGILFSESLLQVNHFEGCQP
jgi:hypothetical protein